MLQKMFKFNDGKLIFSLYYIIEIVFYIRIYYKIINSNLNYYFN